MRVNELSQQLIALSDPALVQVHADRTVYVSSPLWKCLQPLFTAGTLSNSSNRDRPHSRGVYIPIRAACTSVTQGCSGGFKVCFEFVFVFHTALVCVLSVYLSTAFSCSNMFGVRGLWCAGF